MGEKQGHTPADFDRWRTEGQYLPEFMRDFHDQKDLFKALQDVVDRANAKNGSHRSLTASWSEYHIYTVDIFLWVLAAHGYTLQRSRRRFCFRDIYEFVGQARDAARTAMASIFRSAISSPTGEDSPANSASPAETGSDGYAASVIASSEGLK